MMLVRLFQQKQILSPGGVSLSAAELLVKVTGGAIGVNLRAAATKGLPLTDRPWLATPAWASGVSVKSGEVKRNSASQLYIAVSTGISGVTEPTQLTSAATTDGGVLWTHLGPVQGDTADDSFAPAVTFTSSATIPAGLTACFPNDAQAAFTLLGCDAVTYAASYLNLITWKTDGVTNANGECSVAFMTDAPRIGLQALSNSPGIGIRVDGRDLKRGALQASFAGNYWIDIVFSGYKIRKIEILFGKDSSNFMSVGVPSGASIWPYSAPVKIKAAFVGDSYQDGSSYHGFLMGMTFAQCLGRLLGVEDIRPFAKGGTGLINKGVASAFLNYVERVPQILAQDPDVIFVYGSTNDNGSTQAAVTEAAIAFLDAIRAGTAAPVIWMGPVPLNPANVAGIATVDIAISAACAGRSGVHYISPLSDTPPWLTGSDNNAGFSWLSNRTIYIGGDNVHPVDKGVQYLATRFASACTESVYPLLN